MDPRDFWFEFLSERRYELVLVVYYAIVIMQAWDLALKV
jgi:hypothetical protein